MITGAPFLTLALFGLALLVAWLATGKLHEARHAGHEGAISAKSAHIEFLEGQLNEYKTKLSGATADQAAHEIRKLGADLAATTATLEMITKWYQYQTGERHLTADQVKSLGEALKAAPRANMEFLSIGAIAEPEAQQYAIEILNVFKAEGLCRNQIDPNWMHTNTPDERGVLVVVVNENSPPPHATILMGALQSAGIKAKFDSWSAPSHPMACSIGVSHKPSIKDA